MSRRILIAPDKFKGSLSAPEAAAAIAEGIRRLDPTAELDLCPIADGGEGFMESLASALAGRWIHCPAVDALGRPVDSKYVLADTAEGPVAVMEMAETAGLWRLAASERDPLVATTLGVGMQMAHAIAEHQVSRIIMGIGGSATNDGGCGMASALGVIFPDESGVSVDPNPWNLLGATAVDFSNRMTLPRVTAACDVDNPLLGERGATAVFSGQKGATAESKVTLEMALRNLVAISGGEQAAEIPGAGAAGGLGFGLLHFAGAELVSGFDLLADLLKLEERVVKADHVITGEGSIDHQSLSGKGPVALARLAARHGIPVTGFCGMTDDAARGSGIFASLHALADTGLPLEQLIAEAGPLLTAMVEQSNFIQS
ncbi:glycerate kinase [Luteolibacter marinus]|uniref:glycerate kinase n=1 Tax=Luteolibacter marinus TaxID=2776705 RepID=UPI00186888D3|nr:glycerate kinase [Luteolibacter marinus]